MRIENQICSLKVANWGSACQALPWWKQSWFWVGCYFWSGFWEVADIFVRFATFTSVSTLEDCFNSAPHWVDGKQVQHQLLWKIFWRYTVFCVGWDAKGRGGWWCCQWNHWRNQKKCSRPWTTQEQVCLNYGHSGEPKFWQTSFLAGCSLVHLPVRRTGERRALMASTMTSRTMTFARFSCTLGQSRRSGSIGKDQD